MKAFFTGILNRILAIVNGIIDLVVNSVANVKTFVVATISLMVLADLILKGTLGWNAYIVKTISNVASAVKVGDVTLALLVIALAIIFKKQA